MFHILTPTPISYIAASINFDLITLLCYKISSFFIPLLITFKQGAYQIWVTCLRQLHYEKVQLQ